MPPAYFIFKSIIMTVLIVGAFTLFTRKVLRLWRIMKAVKGDGGSLPSDWKNRLPLLFTDILGQKNVRRKSGIGLAHTAILFGFLAVQPHSLATMISSVIPTFNIGALIPGVWGGYLFIADILAFFTLIGFAYVAYRRLRIKPPYLPLTKDALYIVVFTVSIIITFELLTAVEACLPEAHVALSRVPFSGLLAVILGMPSWSAGTLRGVYEAAAWIHILIILGFLIYIPGSKHLHLLAAVPNVLLKPLAVQKAIAATDIEAEDAESFGLGNVSALNWKNVLDLYACTECGRCHEQCPAASTGKPLSPRDVVHNIKETLFHDAALLLRAAPAVGDGADGGSGERREDADETAFTPLVTEDGPITPEQLWSCTSCRACENICPVNIQHLDLIIEARKYQVLMESSFPPELMPAFSNLENQSNPWGFSATDRAEWYSGLDVLPIERIREAEILYFAGSALSLDDRGRKVSRALIRILNKAGVPLAVLGPEELDTGDDARRAGNEYLAQTMIRANIEVLQGHGVTRILTACPHTFNSLKNEYPQFGGNFEVRHHTEYLLELLEKRRISPAGGSAENLTFHDSCYLGRWNGIYDAPRRLITGYNAGVGPKEPAHARDLSFCCGGGGSRMFMEETLGTRINESRCAELRDTGADLVLAACPYCITMLSDGAKELGWQAKVMDPAEFVAERLQ